MYHLVLVTGTLAVLSQALHGLVNESYVLLIDIETQQAQSPCSAATDAVQELKRLTNQIVVVLVILVAQKVLEMDEDKLQAKQPHPFFSGIVLFLGIWETQNSISLETKWKRTKSVSFLTEIRHAYYSWSQGLKSKSDFLKTPLL